MNDEGKPLWVVSSFGYDFPFQGGICVRMRNQSYHRAFEPSEFYDGFPSHLGENNMQKTRFGVLCSSAALILAMSLPAVAQQPGAPGGGQGRGQGRGGGQRG